MIDPIVTPTEQCITQNDYVASSSVVGTSTVSCYKMVDIYTAFFYEFVLVMALVVSVVFIKERV